MKNIVLIPFFFCFLQLTAQSPNSGEYIAVIGKAAGSYAPDMVTFSFDITVKDKKQQVAIQKLNDLSEKTIQILTGLGYNSKQVKLSDYRLGDDMDYYGEKPKNNGYKATINLELEIKYSEKDFNALTDSISKSNISDLNFTYQSAFSDNLKDKIKGELIAKASDDAQNIAQILASSRKVTLGDIFSMEYTDNNFSLYGQGILPPPPPPEERLKDFAAPKISASITMQEIFTEQQVRIIYRIKRQ
jgi:uncharacterized protein YggE